MENITQDINKNTLRVDSISIKVAILILVLNAIGGVTFYIWQKLPGVLESSNGSSLTFVYADLFLAFFLFKRKLWAKKWIIIRVLAACVLAIIAALLKHNIILATDQIIYSLALIVLLSGRVKGVQSVGIAIVIVSLLIYKGFKNINSIQYQVKTNESINTVGQNSYISTKYGFMISAPSNWKILTKDKLTQIENGFLNSSAEVVLLNNDGQSFCLVIPEELKGYSIEVLRAGMLTKIKQREAVEILESNITSNHGNAGFEIKYSYWQDNLHFCDLILYTIYKNVGIQLEVETLEKNADIVFKDIKDVSANIKILN